MQSQKTASVATVLVLSVLFTACKENVNPVASSKTPLDSMAMAIDTVYVDRYPGADSGTNSDTPFSQGFLQGNLISTGSVTDLAIEGRGFFVVQSQGEQKYFRRPGHFYVTHEGYFALDYDSASRLQGIAIPRDKSRRRALDTLTANGDTTLNGMTGDIRLNVVNGRMRESAGPKATTKVTYGGNLDANGEGLGTILHTNRFLATVRSTLPNPLQPLLETKLTSLNDENGNHLGIRSGDIFTISVTNPADGTVTTLEYEVSSATTLHDLLQQVESVLQSFDPGISVSLQPDGTVLVDMDSAQTGVSLSDLTFRTNRPISDPQVADLFSWPATLINQAESGSHYASLGGVRRPAEEDDLLSEVFDAAGRPLGLEGGAAPGSSGDRICINGSVGGRGISYGEKIVYSSEITIGDLMQHIRAAFRLPAYTEPGGTVRSVDFAPRGSSRFPDGAIVIRGLPGYEFAIESISITATNDNNNAQAPNAFISNCAMTEVQAARSPETHASAITVYDSSGYEHTMITTFTHAGNPGEWIWRIHMADDEAVVAGGEGMLVFGVDGTPLKMSYDDGANGFRYRSEHTPGAAPIRLDMGASGSLKGITQFRVPSNAAAAVQDGYARGFMVEMSITQRGTITGIYSNGLNRALYQIVLAQFLNPSFLDRKGRYYVPNEKSGPAVVLTPETTGAKLRIGTLEADTE